MIGSGANPSGDQTRRGGGGSGVSGGPMISARSGRSPSGIGGRSGAAIVPARQLDGGTQPMQRCAGLALAGAVGATEIAGACCVMPANGGGAASGEERVGVG